MSKISSSPKDKPQKRNRKLPTGKGKSWTDKLLSDKQHVVKRIERDFADIPAGSSMLIATPGIIEDYIQQLPKGKSGTVQTLRKDLAATFQAEYTCPVTTGIFLRIVSEAAHEQWLQGEKLSSITPFWRIVEENSPLAKKLSFGAEFIREQRKKEGIPVTVKKGRK